MPRSPRFITLDKELKKLRKYFLPKKFDPTGSYTERKLSLTIAYRVLAHAEIESYLEDRVNEVVDSAIEAWKQKKQTRRTLLCLLAFSGLTLETPPKSITPSQPNQKKILEEQLKIDKKIAKAVGEFKKYVRQNHGVKEANILALLVTYWHRK